MESFLSNSGLLHPNQSAYRKGVSCADAIFATQESINRYMQEGDEVYLCLYDLLKLHYCYIEYLQLGSTPRHGAYLKMGTPMLLVVCG